MANTDINIPDFIRRLSQSLGKDLFSDPMISQLGISEVMTRYLDMVKSTTNENEYLKDKLHKSKQSQMAQQSPIMGEEEKRQMLDMLSNGLVSQKDVAGAFGFDLGDEEEKMTKATASTTFDMEEMERGLDDLAKQAEEIKIQQQAFHEISVCRIYALRHHGHNPKMTKRIENVSNELLFQVDISDPWNYDPIVLQEIDKMSDLELERIYNETEFKHYFELIG